jgi:hypothetical protein
MRQNPLHYLNTLVRLTAIALNIYGLTPMNWLLKPLLAHDNNAPNQLITDPDSVMDAARPERNDTTSKENAKRVGQEILGARHVHEFLSDSEGSFEGISPGCLMTDNRLAELQSASNQLARRIHRL